MKQPEYTAIIIDYFLQLLEVNCPLSDAVVRTQKKIDALSDVTDEDITYDLIDRIAKQIGGKR